MPEETGAPPGSFGVEGLTRAVNALHEHLDGTLSQMRQEQRAGFHRLERLEKIIMGQIQDMDVKLENIANQETQLGIDIQKVVDALKAIPNPPQDLTAQLAKLDAIGQKLIDTSASTLANLPVVDPVPVPARRR